MRKDKLLSRFVHESCARIKQAVVKGFKDITTDASVASSPASEEFKDVTADASAPTLPHGLAQSSLADYSFERMVQVHKVRVTSQRRGSRQRCGMGFGSGLELSAIQGDYMQTRNGETDFDEISTFRSSAQVSSRGFEVRW